MPQEGVIQLVFLGETWTFVTQRQILWHFWDCDKFLRLRDSGTIWDLNWNKLCLI